MTDNEATRTTFVRTRQALHEARCYKVEAENFGLEALTSLVLGALLLSRTQGSRTRIQASRIHTNLSSTQ